MYDLEQASWVYSAAGSGLHKTDVEAVGSMISTFTYDVNFLIAVVT